MNLVQVRLQSGQIDELLWANGAIEQLMRHILMIGYDVLFHVGQTLDIDLTVIALDHLYLHVSYSMSLEDVILHRRFGQVSLFTVRALDDLTSGSMNYNHMFGELVVFLHDTDAVSALGIIE